MKEVIKKHYMKFSALFLAVIVFATYASVSRSLGDPELSELAVITYAGLYSNYMGDYNEVFDGDRAVIDSHLDICYEFELSTAQLGVIRDLLDDLGGEPLIATLPLGDNIKLSGYDAEDWCWAPAYISGVYQDHLRYATMVKDVANNLWYLRFKGEYWNEVYDDDGIYCDGIYAACEFDPAQVTSDGPYTISLIDGSDITVNVYNPPNFFDLADVTDVSLYANGVKVNPDDTVSIYSNLKIRYYFDVGDAAVTHIMYDLMYTGYYGDLSCYTKLSFESLDNKIIPSLGGWYDNLSAYSMSFAWLDSNLYGAAYPITVYFEGEFWDDFGIHMYTGIYDDSYLEFDCSFDMTQITHDGVYELLLMSGVSAPFNITVEDFTVPPLPPQGTGPLQKSGSIFGYPEAYDGIIEWGGTTTAPSVGK